MNVAHEDQVRAAVQGAYEELYEVASKLGDLGVIAPESAAPGIAALVDVIETAHRGPTQRCIHASSPRPLHVVVALPNIYACEICVPVLHQFAIKAEKDNPGCDICGDLDYHRVVICWGYAIIHGRICDSCTNSD